MSELFATAERQLCEQFATTARGPKRNGLFAVWLILRLAGDVLPPHNVTERAHRRRSEALTKRLTSLTLPNALRSPLHNATTALADRSKAQVAHVLSNLVPIVRESLGKQPAAVVTRAVGLVRQT